MSIDWNWGIFLQQAPFGNTTYLGWIWSGFQVTVALSVCAWIIAFFVGSLFGILRTVPNRFLSTLGTCYVELFRNVPLIVQFFTWYLVIPELLPANIGTWFKSELDPNVQFFVSSMLCLGLFTAARVCEQVRAAIQSLPRGQKAAGLAMGLTLPQTYRYVLLPNAYRVIVPPMTSEMLNLVKTPPSPPPSGWWTWPRRPASCWITPHTPMNPLPPSRWLISASTPLSCCLCVWSKRKCSCLATWGVNNVRI